MATSVVGTASNVIRSASGRNPNEIRCQNPDCAAVLDVSSIPVEYESMYKYLFFYKIYK